MTTINLFTKNTIFKVGERSGKGYQVPIMGVTVITIINKFTQKIWRDPIQICTPIKLPAK